MSQLILPSKRIIQPGYPAQINPEFRNLVTSLVTANSYGSYTGNLLQHDLGDFTKSGTVTDNTLTAQGKGAKGNGSTGHFYRSISVPSQAMWLLAVFKAETVTTSLKIPYSLGSSTADTAYTGICSGNGTANNLRAFFRGTSTGGIAISGPTPVAGNVYSCLFVVPSAAENDAYLCVNGAFYNAQEAASTDSGFTATFSYETLLALKRTSTGQYSADTMLLAGYGLGAMPQSLAQSLSANPWQLFTPQKRVIYFAGGASSGNSILSEGFSAADSFSAATIRAALLSESSNSTDSLLPSAQYGRSLSETNALSAIVAASRATQTGLSESGSSQDATNAIGSSVVALQETNAVAALQSATGLYGAGLQESNAANETLAATGSQESSLAETSSIQATQAALYAASANLSESSSVIDTQAAASLIAALVNESISLFDTVDTQTAGVSYIAELIITGDSLSASRTTGAQVVENSGVTDSRSAVKRTNAVLAESQPSLDAVSAESSSIVTLTESSSVASVIALAAATVSVTLTESSILAAQVSAQAMLQVLLGESAVLSDQHGSPQTANVAILEVSAVSDTVINIVFAVSAESRDIVEIRVKEVVESISVGRDRIVAVKTIDTQNIIKGSGMLVHVRLNN